jgi:hypothetical protein
VCAACLSSGADELIECYRRRLATCKVPRPVEFVDSLPKNATGKVLKRELRTLVRFRNSAGRSAHPLCAMSMVTKRFDTAKLTHDKRIIELSGGVDPRTHVCEAGPAGRRISSGDVRLAGVATTRRTRSPYNVVLRERSS